MATLAPLPQAAAGFYKISPVIAINGLNSPVSDNSPRFFGNDSAGCKNWLQLLSCLSAHCHLRQSLASYIACS